MTEVLERDALKQLKVDLLRVFDCRVTYARAGYEQGVLLCDIQETLVHSSIKAKITGTLRIICETQEIGAFWFYKRHSAKINALTKKFVFSRKESLTPYFGNEALVEGSLEFTYFHESEYNKQTAEIETVIFE
jgi:hypothetical protein